MPARRVSNREGAKPLEVCAVPSSPWRGRNVAALLPRVPVAALGVVIAASALQASCSSGSSDEMPTQDRGHGEETDASPFDSSSFDVSPSDDSPTDRADGMSYGDGYGATDAHEMDAAPCVTSTHTYPASQGCPPGNHTWACWPATPVTGLAASRYTVHALCGENVVVDSITQLMWDQHEKPIQSSWTDAADACTASRAGGFSDWRLPSSNELLSIVDYSSTTTPLADPKTFDFQSPENHSTWSSTACAQKAGYAWQLFGSGGVYCEAVATPGYVRCVR